MQKKVIALAVAALASGAAFAQTNVTIYGVMDAFAGVASADNASGKQKMYAVNSGGIGGSRLGFMGEEALGNGLKAVFKLELGTLNNDAATNNIASTRQSYVGVESTQFGKVWLGRTQSYAFGWSVDYDALGQSTAFSPAASIQQLAGLKFVAAGASRLQNAVAYISPTFAGLTVRADAAAGEQVTGTSGTANYDKASKYYSLGANYVQGPLSVGGGYMTIQDNNGTKNGAAEAKVSEWAIGANYDFKVVKPFLSYQQNKNTPAGAAEVTSKLWNLGVNVPVGAAGLIRAAYVDFKNDVSNANVKAKGWAINYNHSLSKRTTAYVGYQQINNGTYASFTTESIGNGTAGSKPVTSADKNASFYGVGINHTF